MSDLNPLEVGEKSRSFLASGDIKIPKETYRIFSFWLLYLKIKLIKLNIINFLIKI